MTEYTDALNNVVTLLCRREIQNSAHAMVAKDSKAGQATAVLCSAGLDSAVLLAVESAAGIGTVRPLYISVGFAWEAAEAAMRDQLVASPSFAAVDAVAKLRVDMHDVYTSSHWAVRGEPPAYDTPDADVCLVGRNAVLLAKAAVYCAHQGLSRIVLGTLAGNPFPDATPEFFDTMGRALSLGLAHEIVIEAPLATSRKSDVIRLGVELGVPLGLSLSCMRPEENRHCGLCSKCRERRNAFAEAGVSDPAKYAATSPR